MYEGNVRVGDLILYENMDSKLIYGIVAEAVSWRKETPDYYQQPNLQKDVTLQYDQDTN